jgi:hypothetical protein
MNEVTGLFCALWLRCPHAPSPSAAPHVAKWVASVRCAAAGLPRPEWQNSCDAGVRCELAHNVREYVPTDWAGLSQWPTLARILFPHFASARLSFHLIYEQQAHCTLEGHVRMRSTDNSRSAAEGALPANFRGFSNTRFGPRFRDSNDRACVSCRQRSDILAHSCTRFHNLVGADRGKPPPEPPASTTGRKFSNQSYVQRGRHRPWSILQGTVAADATDATFGGTASCSASKSGSKAAGNVQLHLGFAARQYQRSNGRFQAACLETDAVAENAIRGSFWRIQQRRLPRRARHSCPCGPHAIGCMLRGLEDVRGSTRVALRQPECHVQLSCALMACSAGKLSRRRTAMLLACPLSEMRSG